MTAKKQSALTIFLLLFYLYGIYSLLDWLDLFSVSKTASDVVELVLNALVGFFAVYLLKKQNQQNLFKLGVPKLSFVFLTVGCYVANIIWNVLTITIFPATQTQVGTETFIAHENIWLTFLFAGIVGPIVEEIIFRGLVMTWLQGYKKYYLDIVVSALLFGLAHTISYQFVLSDFVQYAGTGLIFACLFRKTQSLGYSIALHLFINNVALLLLSN